MIQIDAPNRFVFSEFYAQLTYIYDHRSLGLGYDFEKATNLTRDDYLDYCAKSELLISNKQRLLCRSHPRIMSIVAKGLKMAIDECQSRFTSNRWNCSLALQVSLLNQQPAASRAPVFGEVMKHRKLNPTILPAYN